MKTYTYSSNKTFCAEDIVKSPEAYSLELLHDLYSEDPWIHNLAVNNWEFATGAEIVTSWPYDFQLPISTQCNLKCTFCTFCNNTRYFMPIADLNRFKKMLAFCGNFGFSSYGEPLLHPDFTDYAEKVRSCLDQRATTYLVTNGLLLKKNLTIVADHCNSVTISLHASSQQTHKKLTGVPANSFDHILEGIKCLIQLRDNKSLLSRIELTFVVTSVNLHEAIDFLILAENLGVDAVNFLTLGLNDIQDFSDTFAGSKDKYERLLPSNIENIETYIEDFIIRSAKSKIKVLASPQAWAGDTKSTSKDLNSFPRPYNCRYLYGNLLLSDENFILRPCCYMGIVPGTKTPLYCTCDDDLHKQWNIPQFQRLRSSLSSGKPKGLCVPCSKLQICVFA